MKTHEEGIEKHRDRTLENGVWRKRPRQYRTPYSTLIYEVEILDVLSKAACQKAMEEEKQNETPKSDTMKIDETMQIEQYLKENKIVAKPTASGLYYIEKEKGSGTQATAGSKVKVHYTGTLLNGKKFDSSRDRGEPLEFTIGIGQVIKGWDEGIAMMKVGGKALLVIPSNLAYGSRDMGVIAPNSTLVFEVELVGVN